MDHYEMSLSLDQYYTSSSELRVSVKVLSISERLYLMCYGEVALDVSY